MGNKTFEPTMNRQCLQPQRIENTFEHRIHPALTFYLRSSNTQHICTKVHKGDKCDMWSTKLQMHTHMLRGQALCGALVRAVRAGRACMAVHNPNRKKCGWMNVWPCSHLRGANGPMTSWPDGRLAGWPMASHEKPQKNH